MDLKLHTIFNSSFQSNASLDLKNGIYQLWKAQWEKIYLEQGSSHDPTADDFIRHALYTVLTVNQMVVGFSAHSFFDLNEQSTFDREYFKMFSESYSHYLRSRGYTRLISFESLIVHPDFHKNEWKVSLGKVIIRLNNYLLHTTRAQAMVAVARNDIMVADGLRSMGYQTVEQDKNCRGFSCDLMVLTKRDPSFGSLSRVESLAKNLWELRCIHRGEEFVPPEVGQKARAA